MKIYQKGNSEPSHEKNLPVFPTLRLLMMSMSLFTQYSVVKSFPSGTFLWYGLDKSVSTVPGWTATQMIGLRLRPSSILRFLVTILRAAFDNR